MYLVVEQDRYGTLEIAIFDTVEGAQKFIDVISRGYPNHYKIVVRSPIKIK